MADLSTDEPDAPPEGWDTLAEGTEPSPPDAVAGLAGEAQALIDDLGARREEIAAEHEHEMPLPGFDRKLWARYRLLGAKRVMAMVTGFADDSLTDQQLTYRAAKFLADAVLDVWMQRDETRVNFPGHSEQAPASWTDLPERLIPPRPLGRAHDGPSAIRALLARDNVVVGHALDVATWMQSADRQVSEKFSGESEGGPR